MIVFDAIKDQNVMSFIFNFPPSPARLWAKTTYLISDLLLHEAKGGLYAFLKEACLVDKVFTDDYTSFRGVTHQYLLELRLTNKGLQNFKKVAAIVFNFISFIAVQLENVETIDLFEEIRRMS